MNPPSRFCSIGLVAAMFALGSNGFVWTQSVQERSFVVPNNLEHVEGNSVGWYPFDGLGTGSRYQQVFDASQFSSISNGGTISSIFIRKNGDSRETTAQTISNLQVNLSTTARGPDSLSRVFAENVGSDDTIVFGPGRVSLDASGGPGEPENFSANIGHFSASFFYNPRAGNLLLDIRNYSGSVDDGELFRVDGHDATNDSVSSIFGFAANAPNASQVSSFGFVTLFGAFPVPDVAIFRQSSNVLIRWSYRAGNYILQQSSALGSSANWRPADGIISTNGLYKEVTLPLDPNASARFFRLMLPASASGSANGQTGAETMLIPNPNR